MIPQHDTKTMFPQRGLDTTQQDKVQPDWTDEAEAAVRAAYNSRFTQESRIGQLTKLVVGWVESFAASQRDVTYYRNLVVRCGELLGGDVYVADDGSVTDEVLVDKVPEVLAAKLNHKPQRSAANLEQIAKMLSDAAFLGPQPFPWNTIPWEKEMWLRVAKAATTCPSVPTPKHGTFSVALEALKKGRAIRRMDWPADWCLVIREGASPTPAPYCEHIPGVVFRTPQLDFHSGEDYGPCFVALRDMLAEDWEVVEH